MRLYKYINEKISEEDLDELASYIEQKCERFIKTLKNLQGSRMIYSGRKETDDYIIKKVRKDRKPRDTPEVIHNFLNQLFEEKTGIRLRSESLFVMVDSAQAEQYGKPYAIFPIGKYQLGYNPKVEDLYNEVESMMMSIMSDKIGRVMHIEAFLNRYSIEEGEGNAVGEESKGKIKELVEGYRRGFPEKGMGNIEGMLHCDSYVGVSVDQIDKVMKKLSLENSVIT